ncbi:MAG TPA: putative ABC exporter domain-containing protein [Candidatus Baltobacteraceae bacterium]|nr:putative ABC exporter domain-containing protein [Candidatus Baltobacteraceae bacterium]
MNALATLTYSDRRAFANGVRALLRKPARAIAWAGWLLAIVAFGWLRLGTARHSGARHTAGVGLLGPDFWVGGMVALFAIVLATGAHRFVGVFSSRAEAQFFTGARLPPLVVVGYLQLRAVATMLAQSVTRFAYIVVVGVPAGGTVRGFAFEALFFASIAAATASVALPRAILRGAPMRLAQAAGVALAIAMLIPLAFDAAVAAHVPTAHVPLSALAAWHPGLALISLGSGDPRWIAAPLALVAIASIAFALVARDNYPELYALSLDALEWRARRGVRRAAATPSARRRSGAPVRSTLRAAPRGALAFVWADAVGFARRASPTLTAIVLALALAAGIGLGFATRSDSGMAVGLVVVLSVPVIVVGFAATSAVRLAPLLRLPLFWLGDTPLVARLSACTFGGVWRDVVLVLVGTVAFAATTRTALVSAIVFVCGVGFFALTRAVGVAAFAVFPNAVDQRGPAVMLRTLLTYLLVLPPLVAGALAAFLFNPMFALAAVAGTLVALAEAALLLLFAAWRLEGRIDAVTAA